MIITPVRRAWALSIFWTAVIAAESFVGSSENTSRWLRPVLEFLLGPLRLNTFLLIHASLRKCGHFAGYGLLALFFYRSWWVTLSRRVGRTNLSWRRMLIIWSGRAAVLALLGTLVIAGLDEWHQSYLANRGGSAKDVLLDEMGGALAQLLLVFLSTLRPRRKRPIATALREPVTSA